MNGYDLTRAWYNFKFKDPKRVKANHSDMFFYIVDLWNRLGQKKEFGLPTSVTMEALGIGSYNTYKKTLDDLFKFGFIKLVMDSKNQHQSKIIALSKYDKATDEALDKATIKATDEALDKATDTIYKQLNKEQRTTKQLNNILLSEVKTSDLENEDLEYFQIALAFRDLFIKNLKEKNAPAANQEKAKYKAYVDPIRLMMTNDGITKEQLTKVFKYLGSPQGEFWKPNILSTKKLREKFQQLILKSQENGKQKPKERTNQQIFKSAMESDIAKQFRFK